MKKEYKTPTAEKVVFDYAESVVACPSGCADPGHFWHAGNTWPSCASNNGGCLASGGEETTKPAESQPAGGNSYWGQGWGKICK